MPARHGWFHGDLVAAADAAGILPGYVEGERSFRRRVEARTVVGLTDRLLGARRHP